VAFSNVTTDMKCALLQTGNKLFYHHLFIAIRSLLVQCYLKSPVECKEICTAATGLYIQSHRP